MRRPLPLIPVLLALLPPLSFAQVPTGTPPFGSFGGGPDIVNLADLNSHLDIPVVNKAGRGTNFTYDLSYDSSVWYLAGGWQPVSNWGWRAITEAATGYVTYKIHTQYCANPNPPPSSIRSYYTDTYVYHDAFGSRHPFNVTVQSATCGGGGEWGVAQDGSGYTIIFDNSGDGVYWLTSSSGTVIIPAQIGSASKTDRNGNVFSVNSSGQFFDTLSSTTPVLTVTGSGIPTSPLTFTYTAPSGAGASYKANYTNYTVATNFAVSGIGEYKSTAAVPLVSSIVLPDNSQYTFTYEATPSTPSSGACTPYAGTTCVTARVTKITLPTGGSVTYNYTGGAGTNGSGIFSDGSAATLNRATPDGTWTYAQVKGAGAASTTTVTDPQGNVTSIQFQGIYETQRVVNQGSGTALLTTNTCYNGAASPCTGTAITLPITQRAVITTLPNNLQSKHFDSYSAYGMPTESDDYDYGSGAPGALLRAVTITYASLGNINAFRQQVTVKNGAGTIISQTNNNYDETAVTATSGTPQHTSVSGSRGNLTSINYPVSLTAHFTYYDTGTMNTATDVNGAVTTNSYAGSSCGNSFPTSVSEPLGLSRSMTWNCTGGVQLTATDENNQTVTTTYNDADFWRPNVVTDQLSNQTVFGYQPNPTSCCPTAVGWFLALNNGNSVASDIQFKDGLGRTYVDQKEQYPHSPSLDTVSYTFDANGRPYSVSTPCSVPSTGTCSTAKTTQTYDALNRPLVTTDGGGGTVSYSYTGNDVFVTIGPAPSGENSKRRQLEYDALGRLTSVCEITGATGSGTCGQNSAQTGFWTKYSYDALNDLTGVTQNAQGSSQTRSYTYDAMSRIASETNPESGTTTYAYDSPTSNCSNSAWNANMPGTLVQKQDANGNVTCFLYDQLGRVTNVYVAAGPAQWGNTGCKVLLYDNSAGIFGQGPPSGVTVSNVAGRLAEAVTTDCAWPRYASDILTDEWFSYTARGEQSDVYESTPHSGGYYHSLASYWPNGVLNQLSAAGGYYAAYNVDGEGRVYSTPPGVNALTSTIYNAASQPTQMTFASSDSDSFTYDPNTSRMTQYQFNVNGSSVTGVLGWNANGTLATQNITDPFNSADTQNCSYGYDDVTRIASANCGSAAAQTFSFDPFGNINKSGSPYSFQPTYSSSTNRMTNIAGFTPSYDNNGNVTNDSLHTYTWNADGRPVTIDSVNLTYDALGRIVEQNRSGTYAEIVYAPTGEKIEIMNGQSFTKAFVPLPGGAVAEYTANALTYLHADWLGSPRLGSTPSRTVSFDTAYAPFGETYAASGSIDPAFTSQRQDTVSGLYDFPAREYSIQGRWPSPDPAGLAAVDPNNPQSWNRYAYVDDDPLDLIDPLGLFTIGPCGTDGSLCGGGPIFPIPGQCYDLLLDGISIGNSCNIIGPGPILRSRSGGGGSTMNRATKRVTPCQIQDAVLGALEFTGKIGPEVQVGPVKVGASLYKNFSTGDTGGKIEANAGLVGAQIDNPTPAGGSLGGGSEGTQTSFSFLGVQYNFTTGDLTFAPSKSFTFGAQVLAGGEISFNSDKFTQQSRANDACRAQGVK